MIIDDIALTMQPRVGPVAAKELVEVFGGAANIYTTPRASLIEAGLAADIAGSISRREYHDVAEREYEFCRRNSIAVYDSSDECYPALLAECNDNPHVIYYKGNPEALSARMISIVGTRNMSSYGKEACEAIVGSLCRMFPDLVIVSGLADGIDSVAHSVALTCGNRTIGVIANQFPKISPVSNYGLAIRMCETGGGVLTEYNSQNRDKGANFVRRNRVIAGMSHATIVIESAIKGGSMITAGLADGYHRSVMAVPGRIGDARSAGCNLLIKNNRATLVTSAEDVARELMWESAEPASVEAKVSAKSVVEQHEAEGSISDNIARRLLRILEDGDGVSIDTIANVAGLAVSDVSSKLFELEMDGHVKSLPGKMYRRV